VLEKVRQERRFYLVFICIGKPDTSQNRCLNFDGESSKITFLSLGSRIYGDCEGARRSGHCQLARESRRGDKATGVRWFLIWLLLFSGVFGTRANFSWEVVAILF
jgi:hypothetical protein